MTADEEEEALFGPEEDVDPLYAYKDGYKSGREARENKEKGYRPVEADNPYRTDTESGIVKFDQWRQGFQDAFNARPSAH